MATRHDGTIATTYPIVSGILTAAFTITVMYMVMVTVSIIWTTPTSTTSTTSSLQTPETKTPATTVQDPPFAWNRSFVYPQWLSQESKSWISNFKSSVSQLCLKWTNPFFIFQKRSEYGTFACTVWPFSHRTPLSIQGFKPVKPKKKIPINRWQFWGSPHFQTKPFTNHQSKFRESS